MLALTREEEVPDERYESLFMSLEPILYRWAYGVGDDGIKIGLGAQTTERKIEEAGFTADEFGVVSHVYFPETPLADGRIERYSLDYQTISMLTMSVVQKHEKRINSLEARNEALQIQLDLWTSAG